MTEKRRITPYKGDRGERIEARINTADKKKLTQYLKSAGVTFADWLAEQIKKIDELSES